MSCGPFPISYRGRNARYPKRFQTSNIFCIWFGREPHFELTAEFPGMLCDSCSLYMRVPRPGDLAARAKLKTNQHEMEKFG